MDCLVHAFAKALGCHPQYILDTIGHDGKEVVFERPYQWRSFNIQEMIDVALKLGRSVTEIQRQPISVNPLGKEYKVPVSVDRFQNYLSQSYGVVGGVRFTSKQPHAWVCDHGRIFDPRSGEDVNLGDRIEILWKIK